MTEGRRTGPPWRCRAPGRSNRLAAFLFSLYVRVSRTNGLRRPDMERLEVTAKLRTPLIPGGGYLTFDALLGALLFERCGEVEAAHRAIPLADTDGLFHASAAIFDPGASRRVSFVANLRADHALDPDLLPKKKSGELYRKIGRKRRRDFGAVMNAYRAFDTPQVTWYAEGCGEAVERLLKEARFIGKRRASGFGEVLRWSVEPGGYDGVIGPFGGPPAPRARRNVRGRRGRAQGGRRLAACLLAAGKPGGLLCPGAIGMNAFEFFNRNFGRHLNHAPPGNRPHMDAWRVLSAVHEMQGRKPARLMSGWAVVRPSGTVMQQRLAAGGIAYDARKRADAFGEELDDWDGEPRIFLTFKEAPVPIAHLFLTLDLRAVRICAPGGVETFDYTRPADPEDPAPGRFRRELEKRRRRLAA